MSDASRYFSVRLVKNGPAVGLRVWRSHPTDPVTGELLESRPCIWRCQVNGEDRPIEDVAPWFIDGTGDSIRGNEIIESEYQFLASNSDWHRRYRPDDPIANPTKAVDYNKMAVLKFE